jgi:factor associated with neutral sphingomyelinase activation
VRDIATIGSECIRIRCSQMGAIPITVINGKGRVLKSYIDFPCPTELSLGVHASYMADIFTLMKDLHERSCDQDSLKALVASYLASQDVTFDLTSLTSHREVLLLSKPLRVLRVKKMLEVPGIVQVSKQYVYFQPRAGFGPRKVKRFALTSFGNLSLVSKNLLKYKLKDTCVELQFGNGKILLIQLESKSDRDIFLRTLVCGGSTPRVAPASLGSLPDLTKATDLWRSCEISNFDYLMYLNSLAGRSLNDIGQYPIFPWTISDMSSVTFDPTNPANFRDLCQPIAATNKAKLTLSRQRALQMPQQERFLFGSFYSNPAFVLYFLLRRYPECHLRLHGGHFDHTARLFTSLKGAWDAVSESGSATMELIPEFYSDFDKANSWLLNPPGMTHIPGVVLPEWASSPKDFVIKMRCALESRIVSEKLNDWIDLVFGVKSRGREICFDNNNLFHPICYLTDVETDVVEYCADTETRKDVVLLQSQEFGHVPKQLFPSEKHPKRDLSKLKPEWCTEAFYMKGGGRESWREVISRTNLQL